MSTDTTEQRAREVMMSAFDMLSKTEASLPGIVVDAILAALAAAGIRLAGPGEMIVRLGTHVDDEPLAFDPDDYPLAPITTQPGTSDDAQEGQG